MTQKHIPPSNGGKIGASFIEETKVAWFLFERFPKRLRDAFRSANGHYSAVQMWPIYEYQGVDAVIAILKKADAEIQKKVQTSWYGPSKDAQVEKVVNKYIQ